MAEDLLRSLRQRAEGSSPPVRATALMRIARVESVFDSHQARRTLERGLEEIRGFSGFDRQCLLDQARLLAAAVAPDLVSGIPSDVHSHGLFLSEMVVRIMCEHNHRDAAYDYVMDYHESGTFPIGSVGSLMQQVCEERRLALFRRAVEVWRTPERGRHFNLRFIPLFQAGWTSLPPDEVRQVVREIVNRSLKDPDSPMNARYETDVIITSTRANILFQILHVLRRLDPELAESVIAGNEQLAAAVRRFPNGMETMREEAERQREIAKGRSGGYGMAGNPADFPYMESLLNASRDGEFASPIEYALKQYRQDAASESPNQAPRECWPSTCKFRDILYRIGKNLGRAGASYLDRIPDEDLRLFAEIEFEAARAGLPALQGIQWEYRPATR